MCYEDWYCCGNLGLCCHKEFLCENNQCLKDVQRYNYMKIVSFFTLLLLIVIIILEIDRHKVTIADIGTTFRGFKNVRMRERFIGANVIWLHYVVYIWRQFFDVQATFRDVLKICLCDKSCFAIRFAEYRSSTSRSGSKDNVQVVPFRSDLSDHMTSSYGRERSFPVM